MSDVFSKLTFMKTKLRNLELVIRMFSQKLFTMKKLPFSNNNPKLERQQNSLEGMMEDLLNFTTALCFHDPFVGIWWLINPHPTPFGPLKIRNENLFFYIEHAWPSFLLCRLTLMLQWAGPIWVGFNSRFQLCRQKLEWENQWFAKELIFFESL